MIPRRMIGAYSEAQLYSYCYFTNLRPTIRRFLLFVTIPMELEAILISSQPLISQFFINFMQRAIFTFVFIIWV